MDLSFLIPAFKNLHKINKLWGSTVKDKECLETCSRINTNHENIEHRNGKNTMDGQQRLVREYTNNSLQGPRCYNYKQNGHLSRKTI